MTCRCTHQFCYVCGADWTPIHYNPHNAEGVPQGTNPEGGLNIPEPDEDHCCRCHCNSSFAECLLIAFVKIPVALLLLIAIVVSVVVMLVLLIILGDCAGAIYEHVTEKLATSFMALWE